jgi:mannose/cellobiose epimerase-like protein (N-acyl-D-glucosamine 2-epimerase family)
LSADAGQSVAPYAERLFAFGTQFGIDRREGLEAVFDSVDASGTVVADTKLLWPQTDISRPASRAPNGTTMRRHAPQSRGISH